MVSGVVRLVGLDVANSLHVLGKVSRCDAESMQAGAFTSTWAASHLSMLSDLTLEMCVPSFRCSAAHRMHRKMPT